MNIREIILGTVDANEFPKMGFIEGEEFDKAIIGVDTREGMVVYSLKKILGLQQGKEYLTTKSLRYGGIMIFTDADNDGSHIKGLIINFIHSFWPSLMNIESFISCIITPIVKVSKGLVIKSFYNQSDFIEWKNENDNKVLNLNQNVKPQSNNWRYKRFPQK